MQTSGRRQAWLTLTAMATLALCACGPANERPLHGAVPGSEAAPTPAGVPPTLTASEALRFRALSTPSPGVAAIASPSVSASPSAVSAPPIVRTIAPSANGQVPTGAVTLSAVLVGRGADLASASLSVDGADPGAQIDKRSPREWSIHSSQALANGPHTAKVLVRDASGAPGGFTWQFSVGDAAPAADQPEQPAPAPSPAPKPHNP